MSRRWSRTIYVGNLPGDITERDAAPATANLQASLETYIADAKTHAAKREETANQRWKVLMDNSKVKIDLLRAGTVAKKRNYDLAFLMGGDSAAMDLQVRTWFMEQRRLILSDISSASTSTPTDMSSASPAEMPLAEPTSTLPTSTIDLDSAEKATPIVDLEAAETATPSSAPAPTTTPIVDVDSDVAASPASI